MGENKAKIFLITAFVCLALILNGCVSTASLTTQIPTTAVVQTKDVITSTPRISPTSTRVPTLVQSEKDKLGNLVMKAFNQPGNSFVCNEAKWINDVIKIKCDLAGFIDEPKDHSFVHWGFIKAYSTLINSQPDYLEDVAINLVTIGKKNGTEMASSTNYSTIEKIVNGTITTEVDWAQEAAIASSVPSTLGEFQTTESSTDHLKAQRSDGFYLVGSEIAPGVWDSDGTGDDCYWKVTTAKGDIIENHYGMAGGTAYIPPEAFQVQFQKCGIWTWLQD